MRRLETTSLPIGIAGMPITLAEAKLHDRIEIVKEDSLVTLMIESATTTIEGHVNKRYTDRAYELIFDCEDIDSRVIELERFNDAITITEVTSFGEDNSPTVLTSNEFTLIGRRLQLEDAFFDLEFRKIDSLIIEYSVLKVPASEEIKIAIKELVAHMYENRDVIAIGATVADLPYTIETLIQNERIWNV